MSVPDSGKMGRSVGRRHGGIGHARSPRQVSLRVDALDQIGPSALTTDAIPAALLGATASPVPVTAVYQAARTGIYGPSPGCTRPARHDERLHRRAARRECVDVVGGHAATAGHPASGAGRGARINAVPTGADRIAGDRDEHRPSRELRL